MVEKREEVLLGVQLVETNGRRHDEFVVEKRNHKILSVRRLKREGLKL